MNVVVHGGAGRPPDNPAARQGVLDEAARVGRSASTPLDAVEAAVRVLESSPRFNAGIGGAIQSDGVVRTDAGLMTDTRRAGAVCGVPGVEHPIRLARIVLEETPHVLVGLPGAAALAEANGIETGVDLKTSETRHRWATLGSMPATVADRLEWIADRYGQVPDGSDHDTVGAVATDGTGIAAATSTGGRWIALAGRVGDTPQIGGGFFAGPAGAASATGAGEAIATAGVTRRAVTLLTDGLAPTAAARRAIDRLTDLTDGDAGVIVIDAEGAVGHAYSTDAMQTATARS